MEKSQKIQFASYVVLLSFKVKLAGTNTSSHTAPYACILTFGWELHVFLNTVVLINSEFYCEHINCSVLATAAWLSVFSVIQGKWGPVSVSAFTKCHWCKTSWQPRGKNHWDVFFKLESWVQITLQAASLPSFQVSIYCYSVLDLIFFFLSPLWKQYIQQLPGSAVEQHCSSFPITQAIQRHNRVMHCMVLSSFLWGLVAGTWFWGKVGKEVASVWLWVCGSSRGWNCSPDCWWAPA